MSSAGSSLRRTTPSRITVMVFVALVALVASSGAMFQPGDWYLQLEKPAWTPPGFVFPIAWTLLYLMIAAAGAIAWAGSAGRQRIIAMWAFGVQLILNMAWSWLFFGRHWVLGGLLDITLLLFAIGYTLIRFWRLSPLAGGLLVPYMLWVLYALTLNAGIHVLN